MQDRRRYVANIIRKESRELFGRLFRMYMERAGIAQTDIEEKSTALRDGWADEGFFSKRESGDLTQSTLSKVLNGQYKRPSYGQIFLWLYALEEALKAKGEPFPEDVKDDMFYLMRCVPPKHIVNAYNRLEKMFPSPVQKDDPKKEK